MVCSQIITFIVLFVAITTRGLINTRRCERKSTLGTSASLPPFEYSMSNSCCYSLSILRKFSANILGIDIELWPRVIIETDWKDNKRLKRRREVLHNTRIREKSSWNEHTGYSHSSLGCHGYCKRSPEQFLAGKRLIIYIPVHGPLGFQNVLFGYIHGKS